MAATYTQALLDQVTAYVARPLTGRRQPEGLAELAQLYAAVTGEPAGSCRQCQYADFFQSLQSYLREATRFLHPHLMAESKYTFAPGFENETLTHNAYGTAVTLENLTDKHAEALLKLGGFEHIIIKRGAKPDATEAETGKTAESEALTKAKADTGKAKDALKAEKEAHQATSKEAAEALKAEKQAHHATGKELTDAKKLLTAAEDRLAETLAELAKVRDELTAKTTPAE